MRAAALSIAIALAAAAPAFAQDAPEDEANPYGEPATEDVAPEGDDGAAREPEVSEPEASAPTDTSEIAEPAPTPPAAAARQAPPPRTTSTPPSATQQPVVVVNRRHHDDDDEEEEPDHTPPDPYDIVYIELFGGLTYVDLRAIQVNNYYPEFVKLSGVGGGGGVAAGFRIEFFSVGVRGSLSHYDVVSDMGTPSSFDVGTAAAEVTLSLPIPVVRPFLRAGFGLGWHGDAGVTQVWQSMMPPSDVQTTVFGWVFQGAVGVDVYVAEWLSLGAVVSIDVLNMSRHAWSDPPPDPTTAGMVDFRQSGDAVGVQGRGQASIALHF